MKTETISYRVSPETDAALRRVAKKAGTLDKALRYLLSLQEESPLKPGDFVSAGTHKLKILELENPGWLRALLLDANRLIVQVRSQDVMKYEPTSKELLAWRLQGLIQSS